MIDIKQAVANAKKFAADTLAESGVADFLLEEVRSDDQQYHITLSFPHRLPEQPIYNPMLKGLRHSAREFKTFDVDRETGEISAMAMRSFQE